MSTKDRRPYQSATSLTQALLDASADNMTHKLELVADITMPGGDVLRVSDRHKFVEGVFYEARVKFPEISRTVGQWLAGELEFSTMEIGVNNSDQKFNNLLPGGADYDGFLDAEIEIKIGLAELGSSYTRLFKGRVTDVGGFKRDRTAFTLIARPDIEKVNVSIPNQFLTASDWPDIEDNFIGLGAPIIYGDWTTDLDREKLIPDDETSPVDEVPDIPAFPVNGKDPLVNKSPPPPVVPNPLAGDTPVRCVLASAPISSIDDVWLRRGDNWYQLNPGDITPVPMTDNQVFDIEQKNILVDGGPWVYESGDEFWVKCKGVPIAGGYDDNIIAQARDILERFGGLVSGDFDSSWDYFRDKASPAESDIAGTLSRVWLQEGSQAFQFVLSMLEQVRVEAFVDRLNKFKLASLHFDEFESAPSEIIRNWDLVQGTFNPSIDERNNWNRAKADFRYSPRKSENSRSTPLFKNQDAITQAGRAISKLVVFPQLYKQDQVETQLKEMIKLASAYSEQIDLELTQRAFLLELGEFVMINVSIGNVVYNNVPCLIRSIGYNPQGSLPAKLWSMQLVNFPGYTGPTGTVGGYDATIIQE